MHIKEEVIYSYTIKKSKFITYLNRCDSFEEYKEYLNLIKKKHYDATHVCSAFIINEKKRSSDDGEPSGTAGRPILNVLEKRKMQNTCALVVRYFGGIKLGTGGLTRAYSDAVSEALNNASMTVEQKLYIYNVSINYELNDKLLNYLESNATIISKEYTEYVTYTFGLTNKSSLSKITELLKGKEPTLIGEEIKEVAII